jgi:hypothetical protein
MEENHQADISRLEGQLAQCHIEVNDSETPVSILFIRYYYYYDIILS